MTRTHVGDIAVQVHEAAGEPRGTVLLLHGIGGSADTFAGVAPRLAAAGWHTVAWDAPGYGASADPGPEVTGPDSPGAYVDVVAGLLSRLDVERAHLVGVSWGGVIATHVAARRPELVASLALVDSTRGSGTTAEKAAAMRGRVAELQELGGPAFAGQRARRLLAEDPDPIAAAEVERQMAAVRVPGYAGAAEMMAQSDTGPLLASLVAPALVVVGDEDRVTGVEESRLLAREIPDAQLVLVARAGHAAVQERPAEVAAALLSFLGEQDAGGFEARKLAPQPTQAGGFEARKLAPQPTQTGGTEARGLAPQPTQTGGTEARGLAPQPTEASGFEARKLAPQPTDRTAAPQPTDRTAAPRPPGATR